MPIQEVYEYEGYGKISDSHFKFQELLPDVADWEPEFKYLASAVILSKLIKIKKKLSAKNLECHLPEKIQPREWVLKELCSEEERQSTRQLVKWPKKGQQCGLPFPIDLVFGPEQMQAINSGKEKGKGENSRKQKEKRVVLIMGEAGTGKTTILLAILLKYTGRHLEGKNLKRTVFYIPSHKITFRNYIKFFIEKFCAGNWVTIIGESEEEKIGESIDSVYLLDEIYDINIVSRNMNRGKIYAVLIVTGDMALRLQVFSRPDVELVYCRKVYRSPTDIAKSCSKLKRLIDMKKCGTDLLQRRSFNYNDELSFTHRDIPWEMSFSNQPPLNELCTVRVEALCDNLPNLDTLIQKFHLVLIWVSQKNLIDKFIELLGHTNMLQKTGEDEGYTLFTSKDQTVVLLYEEVRNGHSKSNRKSMSISSRLPFTGSEFKKVLLICEDKAINLDSPQSLIILHASLSRATESGLVLCDREVLPKMQSLLSLSTVDKVFEKLRATDNLGKNLASYFGQNPHDVLEAFKRIIVSKNEAQFNSLRAFITEWSDCRNIWVLEYVQSLLLTCFPWGQEVVNMATSFLRWQGQTKFPRNVFYSEAFLLAKHASYADISYKNMEPGFRNVKNLACPEMSTNILKRLAFHSVCWKERQLLEETFKLLNSRISGKDKFYCKILIYTVTRDDVGALNAVINHIPNPRGKIIRVLKETTAYVSARIFRDLVKSAIASEEAAEDFLLTPCDEDPYNTLTHTFASTSTPECFEMLLSFLKKDTLKFSKKFLDKNQQNILMWAVTNEQNFAQILERAKWQGDLDEILAQKDSIGWSCLRHACYAQNLEVVELLIKKFDFPWENDLDMENRTLIQFINKSEIIHIKEYFNKLSPQQ